MHPIEISHIAKSFGTIQAVADVSFDVQKGEIFGLLGPNGAGKTTTIRMMLDIFKPDAGTVSILGGVMDDSKKARIGYMPEERGLYQDVPLERCLLYLASLKDVPDKEARPRLESYLERFDLLDYRTNKVKELSKGMQQKAQIINTLLHEPELVIIDEPFTALDPINVQLVKDLMRELHHKGVTIIMSTHQMHQVEELCDRILLIDRGRDVLYGSLNEIRRRFSGHEVLVQAEGRLPDLPGIERSETHNSAVKLFLSPDTSPQVLLHSLLERDVVLDRFEIAVPSLDEIFIQVVAEGRKKP